MDISLPVVTGDPFIDAVLIAFVLAIFLGIIGIVFMYFFVWRKMRDEVEPIEKEGIELFKKKFNQ